MKLESTVSAPAKPKRYFLPESLTVNAWEDLRPYFEDLLERPLDSLSDLTKWIRDSSELAAMLEEDAAWRYIEMTRDTNDENKAARYRQFVTDIQPHVSRVSDKLNRKLYDCPFRQELDSPAHQLWFQRIADSIETFREENVPLQSEIQSESQKFGAISGAMSVEIEDEKLTLQQAASLLEERDRELRETVWRKIQARRAEDADKFDELFTVLVQKRHQVAANAGFSNYRDYAFKAMSRAYSPEDCFAFHEAVREEVVPLMSKLVRRRKERLGYERLRPWDFKVDASGQEKLRPYLDATELTDKSIDVFYDLHPKLGECLAIMKKMKRFDLESRVGKAPGGYNYPLYESGVPFVFMNSAGTMRDLVTMMHEGGHAVHSILTRAIQPVDFRSTPAEVAELASMSMELMSMAHWGVFFDDEKLLARARRQHVEDLLSVLPWIAIIDKFQHWLYENPKHSPIERTEAWMEILTAFSDDITDWTGLESYREKMWHKQIHLFEYPFYYIEYAIAQLGAIAVWKRFREDPDATVFRYMAALELGYTQPMDKIYETAGAKFDFTRPYIRQLMQFVNEELETLPE